jgi:hypothetical protein
MPFRLWFYLTRIGGLVFAVVIVLAVVLGDSRAVETVISAMVLIVVPLGLTGAVMGVLMICGRLRMRCPFCGKSGEAGGSKSDGMWMVCPTCGLVRGGGRFGLRIICEKPDEHPPLGDERDPE